MKKAFVLLLVFALAITSVFAAGSAEAKDSGKEKELLVWLPPNTKTNVLDYDFWSNSLEPWAKENNVKIEIEIIPWGEYEAKYLTGFSSGEGPDVGYMYLEMINDYIDMGLLEDLNKHFTEEEKAQYNYYDQGFINGGQYAMPFIVGNQRLFYFNMDILNAAGVTELPETWDDFVAVLQKVQASNPDVVPFGQQWGDAAVGTMNSSYYPFFWQAGGETYTDGKFTFNDTDAAIRSLQFLYDLRFKYNLIPDECLAWSSSTLAQEFNKGRVACVVDSTSSGKNKFTDVNWDYVASLKDKKEAVWTACDSLIVNADSDNVELAVDLVKYMTSAEVMTEYHSKVTTYPPLTKAEPYADDERFLPILEMSDIYHTMPVAKGSAAVNDRLFKNVQLMMMGELTPEQVIENTVSYVQNTSK